jgi:hypothetical protein
VEQERVNWFTRPRSIGWKLAACLVAFVVVMAVGWLVSLGARGSMRGMDERQALQLGEGVAKILMGCWALALLLILSRPRLRK